MPWFKRALLSLSEEESSGATDGDGGFDLAVADSSADMRA